MTSAEADRRRLELAAALADGRAQLKDLKLSRLGEHSAKLALTLFKGRDPESALDSIQSLRAELGQIDDVLEKVYDRGLAAEHQEARQHPFENAWITVRRRRLAALTDAAPWRDEWLTSWSDALAALRFAAADAIAELDNTEAGVASLRTRLLSLTRALAAQDWPSTVEIADEVLNNGIVQTATDTRLRVLRCRILRRFLNDLDGAETAAGEVMNRTANADVEFRDLAVAAVAEIRFARQDRDGVHQLMDDRVDRDAGAADLLIIAGRLAEAEERFSDARDCYDTAGLRFGAAAGIGALYVETPGTLLWRIARQVRWHDGRAALELIARAQDEGVTGKGVDPERRLILEKARILDELEEHAEAASAYHEAGERYAWSGSDRALELFRRAVDLDADNPLFRWSYGESLRQRATAKDWDIDRHLLTRAKRELDAGFELARPTPRDAWAFASIALVDEALEIDDDPALGFERALLLDLEYARGYALLATVLRDHGYYADALVTAAAGYRLTTADAYLVAVHVYSLLDLGELDQAQAVAEKYVRDKGFDLDVCVAQANVQLRRGNPAAALAILEEAGDEPNTRLERAICHAALRDYADEHELYEEILADADDTTDPGLVGWAAYRVGQLDRAIELLRSVQQVGPGGLDLAQVLLRRGSADDVGTGRELLLSSIETSRSIGNLSHLMSYDLPLLLDAVLDTPHESAVRDACAVAADAGEQRIATLRSLGRPADLPSVRLASARTALSQNDLRRAAELYLPFVQDRDPPEVVRRLAEVVDRLMSRGDALLSGGDLPAAQRTWEWLRDLPRAAIDDQIRAAVQSRLALCEIEAPVPLEETSADQLRRTDRESLHEVVRTFARDVPSLWKQIDGLSEVFADEVVESPVANVAARRRLYADVYALDRDAVPEFATSPFVSAIEIALGDGLAHLQDSTEIEQLIGSLRDQLTDEMGVWVPGVGVRVRTDLEPRTAAFQVYGRTMATLTLPAGQPELLTRLGGRLDDVLRDNLFRWISVDDLELWISKWDASAYHADGDQSWLPKDPAGCLRLTRLLRMLVREGVPVRDRDTIGKAFTDADNTNQYDLLTAVRRRLHPWTLGAHGGETVAPVPLPAELEARVVAGLAGDGSTWAMSRASANQLIEDLRAWRTSTLPSGRVAIRTASREHRPYVWRLLAAERPRIFVVAAEELP